MNPRLLIAIVTLAGLALPASGAGQGGTIQTQDVVKIGKVYISGENPTIRLLDKQDGTALTVVSFWRVIWSPVGQGHVAYITTGDGKPGDLRIALVDNPPLFEYLTHQIRGVVDRASIDRPFTIIQGTFSQSGNTQKEWTESFKSDRYNVSLTWRDFLEPFQYDTPTGGARNPFGVTSLLIPAKAAEVVINGKRAAGNVYPQMRGPAHSSTAFLAFSESWIK